MKHTTLYRSISLFTMLILFITLFVQSYASVPTMNYRDIMPYVSKVKNSVYAVYPLSNSKWLFESSDKSDNKETVLQIFDSNSNVVAAKTRFDDQDHIIKVNNQNSISVLLLESWQIRNYNGDLKLLNQINIPKTYSGMDAIDYFSERNLLTYVVDNNHLELVDLNSNESSRISLAKAGISKVLNLSYLTDTILAFSCFLKGGGGAKGIGILNVEKMSYQLYPSEFSIIETSRSGSALFHPTCELSIDYGNQVLIVNALGKPRIPQNVLLSSSLSSFSATLSANGMYIAAVSDESADFIEVERFKLTNDSNYLKELSIRIPKDTTTMGTFYCAACKLAINENGDMCILIKEERDHAYLIQ